MIEIGIPKLLLADATVASLIGTRLYPLIMPESSTLPAATYQVISTVETYTVDGPLGLAQTRLQLDAWGNTYADAKGIATAIHAVLDGYFGTLPDGTVVRAIQRDDSHDSYDPTARLYRVQTDWLVFAELS